MLTSPALSSNVRPRLRLRLERKGNGWLASTASGVRTGEIMLSKYLRSQSAAKAGNSSGWANGSCSRSISCKTSFNRRYCCFTSLCTDLAMADSCWAGDRPDGSTHSRDSSIWFFSVPTRTMKNSSRLEPAIAMKRSRSSKGLSWTEASSSTRSLNFSQLSSRFR